MMTRRNKVQNKYSIECFYVKLRKAKYDSLLFQYIYVDDKYCEINQEIMNTECRIVVTRFWKWGIRRKTEQGKYNFRRKEERKEGRKKEGREGGRV